MNPLQWLVRIGRDAGGSTATEYGLLVSLLVFVTMGALCGVSSGLGRTFYQLALALQ